MVKNEFITLDAANGGVRWAQELLKKSEGSNRSLRSSHVQKLAKIMLGGRWQSDASSSFVITKSGMLKEGQHRLRAFIEAAKVNPKLIISFWLRSGVPDEQAYAVQANAAAHSFADMLESNNLNGQNGPILKLIMNRGMSIGAKAAVSAEAILNRGRQLDAVINQVRGMVADKKMIKTAPVLAAITRALINTSKRKEIERFCKILTHEEIPSMNAPWERWPLMLSDHLMTESSRNCQEVLASYRKTQAALQMFLERAEPSDRVRPARAELFPLAGDTQADNTKLGTAYLIPVRGRGPRNGQTIIQEAIQKKVIALPEVLAQRMLPNTPVCLLDQGSRRVAAVGILKRSATNVKQALELTFSQLKATTGPEITTKLIDLSVSHRRFPEVDRMMREVTRITEGDVEILTRS
jgi:hypothetical protein